MRCTQRWALSGWAPSVSQLLKVEPPPCRSSISQHAQRRRKELEFRKWHRRARGYHRILDPLAVNIEIRRRVGGSGKMEARPPFYPTPRSTIEDMGRASPTLVLQRVSLTRSWTELAGVGQHGGLEKLSRSHSYHPISFRASQHRGTLCGWPPIKMFLNGIDASSSRVSCFRKISFIVIHKRCWSHLHRDEELWLSIDVSGVRNS